jgi:hypothetical protein
VEDQGPTRPPGAEVTVQPEPGPSAPSSVPFPTRDELVQTWGDHVIGRLRPKAKALYQAGRFVGVDGNRAVFALPNEIHRTRCAEMQSEIEAALSERFGRPIPLELVVEAGTGPGAGASAPAPAPDPPADSATPPERAPAPSTRPAARASPGPETRPEESGPADADVDAEDLSVFDEAELGEVADVDNSAETRVLQAFPGAEEVK